MKIIGINYLSESSVALIENGEVKFAISQERLNRIKNWYGNPYKAINFVLKMTKNKIRDIDIFATHGSSALEKEIPNKINFDNKIQEIKFSKLNTNQKKKQIFNLKKRLSREIKVKKNIKESGKFKKKIQKTRNIRSS